METSKAALLCALRQQVKEIEQSGALPASNSVLGGNPVAGTQAGSAPESRECTPRSTEGKASLELNSEYAFKRLTTLCLHQERSTKEVHERLKRIGFEESVADEAIKRAVNCGLIDDMRYADILVRSRISQGRGSQGIENELRRLGLDPYDVAAFNEYCAMDEPSSEYDRAMKFLAAHPTRSKNPKNACYRKLVMKGYSASLASRAARDFCGG